MLEGRSASGSVLHGWLEVVLTDKWCVCGYLTYLRTNVTNTTELSEISQRL